MSYQNVFCFFTLCSRGHSLLHMHLNDQLKNIKLTSHMDKHDLCITATLIAVIGMALSSVYQMLLNAFLCCRHQPAYYWPARGK